MTDRRERLAAARLYLVCDQRSDSFLRAVLRGGVDIVQLRMKGHSDAEILAVARRFARLCEEFEALLIVNDRPELVAEARADGVHVGQEDLPAGQARAIVGPDRLVGISTHTEKDIASAGHGDYIGVGPVHATPTKPGRAAVGLGLVRYAAATAEIPFFAIGGINASNVAAVRGAGAGRIAVVRALTNAPDPQLAARELRAALALQAERGEAPVGTA